MTALERATGRRAGGDRNAPSSERARPARAADRPRALALVGRGRSWWKRFLVWALVLSVPCWTLADAYHAGLRVATSFLLGVALPPQPPGEIEVHATQVLGIFTAMCLASVGAPMSRRLRAIAIGLPVLFGVEVLTGVVAIRSEVIAQTGGGLPPWLLRFRDQALMAPPWLGGPLIWVLLLGRWQFPVPRPGARTAPRPPQGGEE